MDSFETLTLLLFLAAIVVGIAQKIRIPYPIALVLGGAALGFIPGIQAISFDPKVLLTVVLPPILYYAAFTISFREFKRNWKEIASLALGLVVLTTLVVGLIFKWIFPEYPWALAFAFGAAVSPTDSIAATTIMKRFAISPRLLAVVEGESLVNDASGLVLYKLSVVALLSGVFSITQSSLEFVKIVSGGTIVGLVMGFCTQNLSRRYFEPVVGVLFSFTIPYITFILADSLGVSGVLAVVANGLIGSRILAKHPAPLRRILGFAFWDIFIILMNCFVFILIGTQLRGFIHVMTLQQLLLSTSYALIITLALIVLRVLWVYSAYMTKPYSTQHVREATIVGWSGMRGIISLTAVLALPAGIEGREEVIIITFIVLMLTLVLPSCTMAYLIRMMKMDYHADHYRAHRTRKRLVEVAVDTIRHMQELKKITEREYHILEGYFHLHRFVFEISTSSLKKMSNLERARLSVFEAQRNELLAMWERQELDDKLFRQLEHELDIEETRIARAELKF